MTDTFVVDRTGASSLTAYPTTNQGPRNHIREPWQNKANPLSQHAAHACDSCGHGRLVRWLQELIRDSGELSYVRGAGIKQLLLLGVELNLDDLLNTL